MEKIQICLYVQGLEFDSQLLHIFINQFTMLKHSETENIKKKNKQIHKQTMRYSSKFIQSRSLISRIYLKLKLPSVIKSTPSSSNDIYNQ